MKRIILLFCISFLMLSGCSNKALKVDAEASQIVFIKDHDILTVSVVTKNESTSQPESFQIKIEFSDEKLQNILQSKTFLVGEDLVPTDDEGHIYEVKKGGEIVGGSSFDIDGDISSNELKEIVSKHNSIKVILLDDDGKPITSEYIHNFTETNSGQKPY